jgi:hypothetical protein
MSDFTPLCPHFDGKSYKIDGKNYLSGVTFVPLFGAIFCGQSEEAENPEKSRHE